MKLFILIMITLGVGITTVSLVVALHKAGCPPVEKKKTGISDAVKSQLKDNIDTRWELTQRIADSVNLMADNTIQQLNYSIELRKSLLDYTRTGGEKYFRAALKYQRLAEGCYYQNIRIHKWVENNAKK
jgi:hypothetical protein